MDCHINDYLSAPLTASFSYHYIMLLTPLLPQNALKTLSQLLGENLHLDATHLLTHGYDATAHIHLPQAVALPTTMDQATGVLSIAAEYFIPITPRGAGSGFSGGSLATKGGIILVLDRLQDFVIDPIAAVATCQAGVINGALDRAAANHQLMYAPDPASREFCTIGGNLAENAGGPRCLKYGVTRDSVLSVDAWSPAHGFFHASRYQQPTLMDLLIGSEGTLAVFLKTELALVPLPTHRISLSAAFLHLQDAGKAVSDILNCGILPARLELMDQVCLQAVESYSHLGLPINAAALLLVELDGFHPLKEDAKAVSDVLRTHNATVQEAQDKDEQTLLWEARNAASPALARVAPDKMNEDVAVPPSRLPELLAAAQEISREEGVAIPCFGHAGDGNLHVNIMYDSRQPGTTERAHKAAERVFETAILLGGTISGEHGIGLAKATYLGRQRDSEYLEAMHATKTLFDPNNILNPGKMGL